MTLNIEIRTNCHKNGQIGLYVWNSRITSDENEAIGLSSRKCRAESNKTALPPSASKQVEILEQLVDIIDEFIDRNNDSESLPKAPSEGSFSRQEGTGTSDNDLYSRPEPQHLQ